MPPIASNQSSNSNTSAGGNSGDGLTLEQRHAQLEAEATQLRRTSTAASTLLSDPTVRSVLEVKQRGEEPVVLSKADFEKLKKQQKEEPENVVTDLNEITDNNELMKEMVKRLGSSLDAVLDAKLGPISNKLQQVEQYASQSIAKTVDQTVTALRAKYQDFKEFESDMLEIAKTSPNLPVEELYILAKTRKNSPITPLSGLSSEKPSRDATSSRIKSLSDSKAPRGRNGFEEILAKAQGRQG